MGVDLENVKTGRGVSFNWRAWSFLLITAEDYGWVPLGTILDFDYRFASLAGGRKLSDITRRKYEKDIVRSCEEWHGGYDCNNSQLVTEEDAKGMFRALMRAVNNRGFQEAVGKDERRLICELMAFLQEGAFRIN